MSTDELSRQGLGLEHSLGISGCSVRSVGFGLWMWRGTDLRALCFESASASVQHCAVCLSQGGFRDVYDVVADGSCTVGLNIVDIGDEM